MDIHQEDEPNQNIYKHYNQNTLDFVIEEVKNRRLKLVDAVRNYGIPRSTILNRIKAENSDRELKKRGAECVLTPEEEAKIVNWLIISAQLGSPKTKEDLMIAARDIRNLRDNSSSPSFKNEIPSPYWVTDFLARHPDVSFRKPEPLSRAAATVTKARITNFFDDFQRFLFENNYLHVLDRPEAFLNLDESGFELNPSVKRVLAQKGQRNVYNVDGAKAKESITATFCVRADGVCLPTQLVFKDTFSKRFEIAREIGKVNADFWFVQTISGWQTKASFESYIKKLIGHIEAEGVQKPVFFFADNHASHINYELFQYCKDREVHFVTFPPNCTHILQACDVGIFGPMKAGWRKELNNYRRQNSGEELNEIGFIGCLKNTIDAVLTKEKIKKAFECTGIFPLNLNRVDLSKCIGGEKEKEAESGILASNLSPNNDRPKYRIMNNNLIVPYNLTSHQPDHQPNEEFFASSSSKRPKLSIIDDQTISIHNSNAAHDEASSSTLSEPIESSYQNQVLVTNTAQNDQPIAVGNTLANNSIGSMISDVAKRISAIHDSLLQVSDQDKDDIFKVSLGLQIFQNLEKKYGEHNETVTESVKTIDDVLSLPEKFKRKTNRTYKKLNYGVMTKDEVLNVYQEDAVKLKAEEEKKEALKAARELKKIQNIKIKQEIVEKNIPKKRGRPKKNA